VADRNHWNAHASASGVRARLDTSVLRVDGLWRGGDFHTATVSRQLTMSTGSRSGPIVASVLLDDGDEQRVARELAAGHLSSSEAGDGVFHLTLARDCAGELSLRHVSPGPESDEIVALHEDLFHVDLRAEAICVDLGSPSLTPPYETTYHGSGGFVALPVPGPYPVRIVRCASLAGGVHHLYRERLPHAGDVIDDTRATLSGAGGVFYLFGADESTVWAAVEEVVAGYRLVTEQVASDARTFRLSS
jgi:hypothetical protein